MRILRFFTASSVAFLISSVLYIVSLLTVDSFREEGAYKFIGFMLSFYLLPFCYVGCLLGELVYTFASKITNRLIVTIIFALTGALYSYLIHKFWLHGNPIDLYFYLAILGSISFYWAHLINNRRLSIQLSVIPGYVILLSLVLIAV
jgi:hypothetical protein